MTVDNDNGGPSSERADVFALRGSRNKTPKEADASPAVMLDCGYRGSHGAVSCSYRRALSSHTAVVLRSPVTRSSQLPINDGSPFTMKMCWDVLPQLVGDQC